MPHPIRATWLTRPGWSEFGAWRKSGGHKGFDYYCPEGTPIYATGHGRVAHIGSNMDPVLGFGHSVRIAYPGSRVTIDAHMRARTPLNVGQSVTPDTIVGHVGKTGNAFRTVWSAIYDGLRKNLRHDHHEVTIRGKLADPIALYGPVFAGDDGTPIPTTPKRRRKDMDAYVISRVEDGKITELSLCHEILVGTTPIEQGYIVIRPSKDANGDPIPLKQALIAAARAHGLGFGITTTNGGDRPSYVAGQQLARDKRKQYLRDRAEFAAEIAKAIGSSGTNNAPPADLSPVMTALKSISDTLGRIFK